MFHSFSSTALVAVIFIITSSTFLPIEANSGGFTINLIHRDSPKSPLYNPLLDHFQHLSSAFHRSLLRSRQYASTNLIPDGGEYLMKISYGTPPFESFAIVDTGSYLTWIQCLPCINCYEENFPPFDPKTSSTFQFVGSTSTECAQLLPTNESSRSHEKPYPYEIRYGDNSYSNGDLATETITFGSGNDRLSFPNFIFGCGHDNVGFSPNGSGLVGLGPQKVSLVSQLSSSISGKFSFCLGPFTEVSKSGKLSFGGQAVVSGPDVVSTPLSLDPYYSLTLERISVGESVLEFVDPSFSSYGSRNFRGGNIIIDSGTTLTYLPSDFYENFETSVRGQIRSNPGTDPTGFFSLCYSSLEDADIPRVTFHFKDADVKLNPLNTFVRNTPSSMCLAFVSTNDLPILGNIAQLNHLVGYDLVNNIVSFKPAHCTK